MSSSISQLDFFFKWLIMNSFPIYFLRHFIILEILLYYRYPFFFPEREKKNLFFLLHIVLFSPTWIHWSDSSPDGTIFRESVLRHADVKCFQRSFNTDQVIGMCFLASIFTHYIQTFRISIPYVWYNIFWYKGFDLIAWYEWYKKSNYNRSYLKQQIILTMNY